MDETGLRRQRIFVSFTNPEAEVENFRIQWERVFIFASLSIIKVRQMVGTSKKGTMKNETFKTEGRDEILPNIPFGNQGKRRQI